MLDARPDFSVIIRDNESALATALAHRNFVQAFLLAHALIESLLRLFLRKSGEKEQFSDLIDAYRQYLATQSYSFPTFIDELRQFNRRRNRMTHQLWRKGFSFTNTQAEPAANAAVLMYGLFIEWLEIFDPEITRVGFTYDDSD